MANETLTYVCEAVDNVTPVTDKIAANQERVISASDSANISFIKQIATVRALHGGLAGITSGMETLGLISDDTAASLNKVNAAVGIVAGSFQLLKAGQAILETLKVTELGLAAVETYRSVLNNPAAIALVGVAAGAAIGAGAALYANNSSSTTVNQTVNFNGGAASVADQRSTSRAVFEAAGGF
jgi:hypothetical protein